MLLGTNGGGFRLYAGATEYGRMYADTSGAILQSVGAVPILFLTNGSERMRLDSSGNLGLGVTPSAWGNIYIAEQIGSTGSIHARAGGVELVGLSSNTYRTNSAANYIVTAPATLYQQTGGTHAWYNAPSGTAGNAITFTQAMTLDASGNLGLGVTPSAWTAGYKTIAVGGAGYSLWNTGSDFGLSANAYHNSGWKYNSTGGAGLYDIAANQHIWYIAPSGTAGNAITFTQAMTLDASGNLLVGTTSASAVAPRVDIQTSNFGLAINTTNGGANEAVRFYNASTAVGTITTTGSATAYNTSSDQRLKKNIQNAPAASDLIDAIQVRSFDWISDDLHQRYGFVAQELVTVAPEAVHQPADPDEMMAVDYSKLVPMLVKEIQSLRVRISQLEAK